MVEYLCHRCGYNTNKKSNIIQHLNRKKICKPILGDISIEEIKKHYNFEINSNVTQTTPKQHLNVTQTTPKQHLNVTPTTYKLSTRVCKYCNKCFTRKSGLTKHLNICVVKKETEALVISQNDKIMKMEKEIEELKKKSTTTNNITNNNNNTINNNIHINNYGEENLKHLRSKDFKDIICSMYNAVPQLIEKIHFDPEHPENQNIKYTNKKFPYLKIMKDNKWQLVNKKHELFDLIDNKCYLLKEKYYKILEKKKYKLTEYQKNKIDEFIDKYNEEDKMVMLDLMERTELMLLNNS